MVYRVFWLFGKEPILLVEAPLVDNLSPLLHESLNGAIGEIEDTARSAVVLNWPSSLEEVSTEFGDVVIRSWVYPFKF